MEKNLEYYESLDKRTKEYKEWKESFEKAQADKPEGLGDVVAKVTEATGIDKVVKKVANAVGVDDCGCEERRNRWNKKFSFGKPECFTEQEYNFLVGFFRENKERVTYDERKQVYDVYNRVFRTAAKVTSCTACWNDKVKRLKTLLNDY